MFIKVWTFNSIRTHFIVGSWPYLDSRRPDQNICKTSNVNDRWFCILRPTWQRYVYFWTRSIDSKTLLKFCFFQNLRLAFRFFFFFFFANHVHGGHSEGVTKSSRGSILQMRESPQEDWKLVHEKTCFFSLTEKLATLTVWKMIIACGLIFVLIFWSHYSGVYHTGIH
jgi:hypothetical protein